MTTNLTDQDRSAAIVGGQQFVDRLRELRTERERAEAAVAELALGKSARDAHNEAHRVLAEARNARESAMAAIAAEIAVAREEIIRWEAAKQQILQNIRATVSEVESG